MSKKKINIIGPGLFRSGGIRVIFEYANRFTANDFDVVYYMPMKLYRVYDDGAIDEAKRYYWALRDLIKGQKFAKAKRDIYPHNFKIVRVPVINDLFVRRADITIATEWPTSYSVAGMSSNKGKKVYLIQDYENWSAKASFVDASYKLDLKRICVSNYLKNFINSKFGVDSEVVMNGVNYDVFFNNNKQYGLRKTITFIDHMLEKKGSKKSIEVAKLLRKKYNHLDFYSFGVKKTNELPDFITFCENPDDQTIADIYRKTDIFLFSSLVEGFGLPPAEAMACKCAVVTTNVGAIADYSIDGESALHVLPGDVSAMVNAVSYLLDNENELVRISENAVLQVRSKLLWDDSVSKFLKIIESN